MPAEKPVTRCPPCCCLWGSRILNRFVDIYNTASGKSTSVVVEEPVEERKESAMAPALEVSLAETPNLMIGTNNWTRSSIQKRPDILAADPIEPYLRPKPISGGYQELKPRPVCRATPRANAMTWLHRETGNVVQPRTCQNGLLPNSREDYPHPPINYRTKKPEDTRRPEIHSRPPQPQVTTWPIPSASQASNTASLPSTHISSKRSARAEKHICNPVNGSANLNSVSHQSCRSQLVREPVPPLMRSQTFVRRQVPKCDGATFTGTREFNPCRPVVFPSYTHLRNIDPKVGYERSHRTLPNPATRSASCRHHVKSSRDAGFLTEPSAFTPRLQARIGYVDDEEGLPADLGYELPSYADVMGGADQGLPILVSRVAPNTPADKSLPRLSEGDQVLAINTQDVSRMSHDQVVQLIRSCREMPHKELVLTVRPNVYNAEEEVEEPAFQYVPDIPHLARLPHVDVLGESMLLLSEGLESGATVAQFEQLYRRKPGMSMNAAKLSENIAKNRYRDISPYDQTRVIIQGGLNGDYINANHINMEIPALGIVNRYIAAQGPLPHTCGDFWQMIWEQQSSLVVMLTSVLERGRIKCHQYWPAIQESQNYGNLRVTCIREQETMNFAFREFTLMNNQTEEERHITQMQYIAWPDHGVPDQASDFVDFVLRVRSQRIGMVEPTIVHCSAGIGRTGVLILMETAMCLIEANEPVYPLDIVRNMRDQRAMLIQNASQYKFVCEAIVKVFNDHTVQPLPEFLR